MNVFILCLFILMILKLGPLLDVNFKSKVQLHFAHMKRCEILVTVS
jgi:hypothetical protein